MNIFKIVCILQILLANVTLVNAKDNSNIKNQIKIPEIPIALKNDTEILDALKQLLLKYYDKLHKSEYYAKLSEELHSKAQEYQISSQKMRKDAEDLLQFIVQKVGEHKALQRQYQQKNLMAIKNSTSTGSQNPNVEHFVQNLAAQLK